MNVKDLFKSITVAILVITGVYIVMKIGQMENLKIKKNKLYLFDNGFDEKSFVIALEDEEDLRYDQDIVYNMSLDFVQVLIENRIEVVLVTDLYAV